jgi:hypothetical protein
VVVAIAACGSLADTAVGADVEPGQVNVQFSVERFVPQGKELVARGFVVATYRPPVGAPTIVRQPFAGRLKPNEPVLGGRALAATSRICEVLVLQLGQLRLDLLGLVVELENVVLTIKANSAGGPLGSLFCSSLANGNEAGEPASTAQRLTQAAKQSGLTTSALGFAVPLTAAAPAQEGTCKLLELILGPLDLRLLGLLVHLNKVHLTVSAAPEGVLGGRLCTPAPVPTP